MNPAWQLGCMSRPTPPTYKTRNWRSYNQALKRRGSLTIWFDPAMMWGAASTGKRGRQPAYSDAAIQTCCRVALKGALPQSVWRRGSILALNSSGPARPYMARLRVFRRLI